MEEPSTGVTEDFVPLVHYVHNYILYCTVIFSKYLEQLKAFAYIYTMDLFTQFTL